MGRTVRDDGVLLTQGSAARWRPRGSVDVEVRGNQVLDQGDLLAVRGVRLDEEVVDLGGDGVCVVADERREQIRPPDRRDHRRSGR